MASPARDRPLSAVMNVDDMDDLPPYLEPTLANGGDHERGARSTERRVQSEAEQIWDHEHEHQGLRNRYRKDIDAHNQNLATPASSRHAEKTVMPFLAQHIPTAYNPTGGEENAIRLAAAKVSLDRRPNLIKYCYRHQPDLKCRRSANEPTMEQLQSGLATLSQSDQQAISHVWSLFSAAPGKHRELMLQGILSQCCFPQLSFIENQVRDLIKIDFLAALPDELGYQILCFLDTTSLCKAAQVSQRWRQLADDDVVWHRMCEQHIDRRCTKCGWGLPRLEQKRLRIEKRQIQLRATGRGLNERLPENASIPEEHGNVLDPAAEAKSSAVVESAAGRKRCVEDDPSLSATTKRQRSEAACEDAVEEACLVPRKRPWKDIYKDRFKVGTAWKYGRCSTRIFKGHTDGVMCVQFAGNVMISGSYDSTIKVWDICTGEELRTLKGHTAGIRCLQFDESGQLWSGSLDATVRLWNWKTGQLIRTFPECHQKGVLTLHYASHWFASGSQDTTICVWDLQTKRRFQLRGHTNWVNSVKIDHESRTLFSASDDLTVRLWDLDSMQCIKMFEGHVGQVQQILPMPIEFELEDHFHPPSEHDDDASSVGSPGRSVSHSNEAQSSPAKEPFWRRDHSRAAPPRYFITGALDSTIRLWDAHANSSSSSSSSSQMPLPTNPLANHTPGLPTDPLTNSHVPRAQACIRTFFGHIEGIWALSADHLRLISGSEDRMIKVWDPRTGKCERSFIGHEGPVNCTWLGDERVASGSDDGTIRVLHFGDQ